MSIPVNQPDKRRRKYKKLAQAQRARPAGSRRVHRRPQGKNRRSAILRSSLSRVTGAQLSKMTAASGIISLTTVAMMVATPPF